MYKGMKGSNLVVHANQPVPERSLLQRLIIGGGPMQLTNC